MCGCRRIYTTKYILLSRRGAGMMARRATIAAQNLFSLEPHVDGHRKFLGEKMRLTVCSTQQILRHAIGFIRQFPLSGGYVCPQSPAPPPPASLRAKFVVVAVVTNSSFGWYDETTAFESMDVPHSNKACYQIEDWRNLETWDGGRERRRESQEVRECVKGSECVLSSGLQY